MQSGRLRIVGRRCGPPTPALAKLERLGRLLVLEQLSAQFEQVRLDLLWRRVEELSPQVHGIDPPVGQTAMKLRVDADGVRGEEESVNVEPNCLHVRSRSRSSVGVGAWCASDRLTIVVPPAWQRERAGAVCKVGRMVGVPFALHEYDAAFSQFFGQTVRALARARSPLLGEMPFVAVGGTLVSRAKPGM